MRALVVSVLVALAGGVLMIVSGVLHARHLAHAWHAAATFGLTVSLGGFLLGAVLASSGAKWSATIRRVHEAIGGSFPIACLAFIPVFHVSRHVAIDVVYLLVVIGVEELWRWASLRNHGRRAGVGAIGLVVSAILMTNFFFDVTRAPSRPWVSDIFGLYVLVGAFGAGTAVTAICAERMQGKLRVTPPQASALGRVMLVATCLWAYCAFAFFMIIWIGDLPREVVYFVPRAREQWGWWCVVLIFGRFVVPFLMLVPRAPKQHWGQLAALGTLLLIMQGLDCELLVVPSVDARPSWLDIGPFLVVGGTCAFVSILRFRRHDPLPEPEEVELALAYQSP